MRELVCVVRDFDFDNILIYEHFCDVVVNVDRIVNKFMTKTTIQKSNSKNKSFVSRVVINDLNNDVDDNDKNNNDDFFFRLRLTCSNEQMTTIYVANAALNNRLIVVMKKVNVLKKIKSLKMIVSIEIVVDREKTAEKKAKKRK